MNISLHKSQPATLWAVCWYKSQVDQASLLARWEGDCQVRPPHHHTHATIVGLWSQFSRGPPQGDIDPDGTPSLYRSCLICKMGALKWLLAPNPHCC